MNGWQRVSKMNRCPKCGNNTWCAVNVNLGIILCMRVESDRPSKGESGGWIHPLAGGKIEFTPKPKPEPPRIDAQKLMLDYWKHTTDAMRQRWARQLGVSVFSLYALGASWAAPYRAVAFPMFSGSRECIGIRLRSESGQKWAVTGSRQGIFIPRMEPQPILFLVEGPTDAAAAVTLGLFVIGRPCCSGCISHVQVAINRLSVKRIVLIADNDGPGIKGAKQLADELQVPCCHALLPTKDLREFVSLGGTRGLLDSLTAQSVWQHPKAINNRGNEQNTTRFYLKNRFTSSSKTQLDAHPPI